MKTLHQTSQWEWSSMTLYTKTDPLVVLAGTAKKQAFKLGENAQSPVGGEKKKSRKQKIQQNYLTAPLLQ